VGLRDGSVQLLRNLITDATNQPTNQHIPAKPGGKGVEAVGDERGLMSISQSPTEFCSNSWLQESPTKCSNPHEPDRKYDAAVQRTIRYSGDI
jgi:hypothetical protein